MQFPSAADGAAQLRRTNWLGIIATGVGTAVVVASVLTVSVILRNRSPATTPPPLVFTACPFSAPPVSSATPASGGSSTAQKTAVPVWSREIGSLSAVEGVSAYVVEQASGSTSQCVASADVATGAIDWASAPPADHPLVFSLLADSTTVLAAIGPEPPTGGGLNAPEVTQLVAYDPADGHPRWRTGVSDDGQGMPALLVGGVVVLAEDDGAVIGLAESDGHQLWRDAPPPRCSGTGYPHLGPSAVPTGVVGKPTSGGAASAVIAYDCPTSAADGIVELDPISGSRVWAWSAPVGWEVATQLATTVDVGSSLGSVVAVPLSLIAPANAPKHTAAPPGPLLTTKIANLYNGDRGDYVLMLDADTGRPLWDLDGVVGNSVSVVGGSGTVCVLTDAGADCRAAISGSPRWSMYWPGKNATLSYPALNCIDLSHSLPPSCAVSTDGRLYVALAANSAPAYPPQPGPASPAGSFVVTALDMTTGSTVAALPLPSFDVQSDHAVSLELPPAVLAVADGKVLVSPQVHETNVMQAFVLPVS